MANMNTNSPIFRSIAWYGTRLQHRGSHRIVDVLRRVAGADIDAELTVARGGLRWQLNPADFVHQDVFWHGSKDRWDVWHIERLLPADAVIVDIGSSFGYYALHLTHALGSAARAFAFEPMPGNFARLSTNIALNDAGGRVRALNYALSDAPGEARMAPRAGNSGSAQIGSRAPDAMVIPLDTLDLTWDRVAASGEGPDFVKIDVEGHEIRVLQGARGVMSRFHPAVLIEVDPPRLAEAGSNTAELQNYFDALGYRAFVTERTHLREVQIGCVQDLVNVICLHKDRHADQIARALQTSRPH